MQVPRFNLLRSTQGVLALTAIATLVGALLVTLFFTQESLLYSQGGIPHSSELALLRKHVGLLERKLAGLVKAVRSINQSSRRSAITPIDLEVIRERIAELERSDGRQVRLLGSNTLLDGQIVRIEDIVYSAAFYRRILMDKHQGPSDRAWAFTHLRSLAHSPALFDEPLRELWISDYYSSPTEGIRRALLAGMPSTCGDPRLQDALVDVLIADPDEALREIAVLGLRHDMSDPAILSVLARATRTDPSESVRRLLQQIQKP